jgi:DNA-binding protein H-NS
MNLKSISVEKLVDLRNRVQTALATRVAEERRTLESELSKLTRLGNGSGRGRATARGKVAPKYRNPENPSETWAGRGLRSRWLAAALKTGKKIEQFAIRPAAQTVARRPKARKAAKK